MKKFIVLVASAILGIMVMTLLPYESYEVCFEDGSCKVMARKEKEEYYQVK